MGEQILKNSSFWCYLVVALKFQSGLTFFQSIASLFGAGGRHSVFESSPVLCERNWDLQIKSGRGFMDLAISSGFLFVLEV